MAMKISVAMATYNGERFLEAQLESIVSQTHKPNELVISDDCSTDGTMKLVRGFSARAPFVVHLYQNESRLGYSQNFNRALMGTTGDVVFLCDQDDVWFPEKIEIMTQVLRDKGDVLVAMNDAELTDEGLTPIGVTKQAQIRSVGEGASTFVMGCCMAIRRELLDLCLPIPEEFVGHDKWLAYLAEGMGRKYTVKNVLQYYRRSDASTVKSVVNDTRPATKLRAFVAKVKRNRQYGGVEQVEREIAQTEMLHAACQRIENYGRDVYQNELQAFKCTLEVKLTNLNRRAVLRRQLRMIRAATALALWAKNGYMRVGGWRGAVRDIFIR